VSSWLKHRLSAPSSHELAIRGFVTSALERVSHHDVAGIMQAVNDDHMVLCNAPHRGAPRSGFGEGLEGLVGSGPAPRPPPRHSGPRARPRASALLFSPICA